MSSARTAFQQGSRARAGWAAAAAALSALLVAGCDLSGDAPIVRPVGPTADATPLPQPIVTAEPVVDPYEEAAERIEELLAQQATEPITVVDGLVPETEDPFEAQIMELRATDLSLVLHIHLKPADGRPLDLTHLDGGLSGQLGEGNRTIADFALVDEISQQQIMPTVYRADVSTEDPQQRCMCSSLPAMLPPDGVRLTAHFVRPEEGFESIKVKVPGSGLSASIFPAARN